MITPKRSTFFGMTTGIDVMHNAQILGEIYINHSMKIYQAKLRNYKKFYKIYQDELFINRKFVILLINIDYHVQFELMFLTF